MEFAPLAGDSRHPSKKRRTLVFLARKFERMRGNTMKYTKPHVLATSNGNLAIQSMSGPQDKLTPHVIDSLNVRSTTAAYEADE
jgi:hypothetical protein